MAEINPLKGLYADLTNIAKSAVIKYTYLATEKETVDTKRDSELYIGAKLRTDTFFFYAHYEEELLSKVGINDSRLIEQYTSSIDSIAYQY